MKPKYWLDRVQASDRFLVGEKAFFLSQLKQYLCPIFPGFIISDAIFREFLDILNNSDSLLVDFPYSSLHLDVDNPKTLKFVAQNSRQVIRQASLPAEWLEDFMEAARQLNSPTLILSPSLSLPVSVRQKFNQRFTSLFSSQVCWCESEALEVAVKQIWAEFFSAKSLFYWQRMGIGLEQINLAILVQPIGNAIASGTAEIDSDRFCLRATWGLGCSLSRGEVSPDYYEIERGTGELKNRQLGNKIRAYRLKNRSQISDINESCLEAYLLGEWEQTQSVLDESKLGLAIEHLAHLASQQQYRGSVEWTLIEDAESSSPQFYFTQANPLLFPPTRTASSASQSTMSDSPPFLTGLSASPGVAIAFSHIISSSTFHLDIVPEGRILVAEAIDPKWLPWLKKAAGIITEVGGMTSHGAILARELGIPAIVGARGATKLLKTGEKIELRGDRAEVYRLSAKESAKEESSEDKVKTSEQTQKVVPHYPIATKLMVNLSQIDSIARVRNLPIDGVGLLRSDLLWLELIDGQPLTEWLEESRRSLLLDRLAESIKKFAKAFAPQPVFYRSLDWMPSEWERFSGADKSHSWLGKRGTYNYLLDSTLFDLELQALSRIRASGCTNVRLILPFVRSLEEFIFCRRRVEEAGLWQQKSFQLWIMAEVPSVLFLLPEYVRAGVQGIAIGSNDLTQLVLGSDREESGFSEPFNAFHPAMLAAIEQLISLAKKHGIPCSICGQAPTQYPELIEDLIRWGITSISVEPEAVESTYDAIARAEHQLLLELARERHRSILSTQSKINEQ